MFNHKGQVSNICTSNNSPFNETQDNNNCAPGDRKLKENLKMLEQEISSSWSQKQKSVESKHVFFFEPDLC